MVKPESFKGRAMRAAPDRDAAIPLQNRHGGCWMRAEPHSGAIRTHFMSAYLPDLQQSLWIGLLLLVLILLAGRSFVFIPNDSFGVVERTWSFRAGARAGFMATRGGTGFLPDTIRGGWHAFMPYQYRVHRQKLITVRSIGYLFARTGAPLAEGQALAVWPADVDPGDAAAFLAQGGQGGPQRRILRAATYAINTALFVVLTDEGVHQIQLGDADKASALHSLITARQGYEPVVIDSDRVAIVTVQDGPALEHGEIIAPTVGTDAKLAANFHNSFQDIPRFLAAGGRRGRQEQVLVEGTYYINRLFATVELTGKTQIGIGHVGVVISYTGPRGDDISGEDYKHGKLVEPGQRGVWKTPLQPGKYAVNPYAQDVKLVPTTNFQLRWIENSTTDIHNFDENLAEIRLITKDAFEPILPLSIVVHIAQDDAPYVVQQFAEIGKLVDQTLDPMVSAWFKDAAQEMTLIELVGKRAELQAKALGEMKIRFQKYRLNVMEVMIGTPRAMPGDKHIDTVFEQLRVRQVAREQAATYASQQEASFKERELNEARAIAAQQTALTASKVAIQVAQNEGDAQLQRRTRDAEGIKITAAAEAERTRVSGQAEADRTRALGEAEASATKAQSDALGGPDAALRKMIAHIAADAMQHASQPLVPQIVLGGERGTTGIVDLLMAMSLADGTVGAALRK
jgi:uncharacterized membrane protein YqiK